jgi:hypothetical protein
MILVGFVLGAIFGGVTARRRGGKALDIAQYAGAYAILFALIGLIVTVASNRLLVG